MRFFRWGRIAVTVLIFSMIGLKSNAQGLEIGGGLGIANTSGDLTRGFEFAEIGLAGQLFVRYNLSNVVSLRANGMVGSIRGSDETNPIDPFAALRDRDFNRIVLEASGVVEYNFLDYKERTSLINWSPYFFAGFGLSAYSSKPSSSTYSRIQPVIPFGIGLKYRMTKQWNLEFEFGARKTFFDYVDNVSSVPNPNKLAPKYGNELDNDWYYFTGISISYTFYSIPCPFNSY
jgi:hypothetical protein